MGICTNELNRLYGVLDNLSIENIEKIFYRKTGKLGIYTIKNHYMIFKQPIYVKDNTFRLIPNFPRYGVNNIGSILDLNTGLILNQNKSDYVFVSIFVPSRNETRNIGVHRLVALAWCYNSHPSLKIQVNHKDGNKQNNVFTNLEWVTPRENIMHALDEKLRTDNVHCRVFDIKTQTEHQFSSLAQAGRFMGYMPSRQNSNGGISIESFNLTFPESLVKKRYEFRLENDDRPWYYLGKTEYEPPSRYKIYVKKDGKVIKDYPGSREFIKDYKLWNLSQNTQLLCEVARKRYPGLEFEWEDRNPIVSVQARNVETGVVVEANSRKELARKLNISDSVVKFAIKNNRKIPYNGWVLRFKSKEPWDDPEDLNCQPRCIAVTNIESGEKQVCESIRDVARLLGIEDRKAISLRVNSDLPLENYLLSEVRLDQKCLSDSSLIAGSP